MDPWFVVALLVAVVAAALGVLATRRGTELGRIDRALGIGRDEDPAAAATRLRAEASASTLALATSLATTERLTEVVGPGILAIDAARRITGANAAAAEHLRTTPPALVGRTLMEAFLDRAVDDAAQAGLDAGSAALEVRPGGADGPTLSIRIQRAPGDSAWLILDDVSELRRLQRIRTEFIDNLSHELRTPLTTVSLLAETLARESTAPELHVPDRMRDRIAKIEIETGHLVQMVNELLDLSRIESGGTITLIDGVDLGRLAREAAERLRLFAERQGVALRVVVEPDLPTIRGDAARLGQVVVNLVHNAVKFSPDGGDVTVRVVRDDDTVVVAVEDHGVGIPKAAQARVFERFYKVDRARLRAEVGGGTGLGLAIARHVIEQHGGRIWVESKEGVGSTFRFALPAGRGPSPAHAT